MSHNTCHILTPLVYDSLAIFLKHVERLDKETIVLIMICIRRDIDKSIDLYNLKSVRTFMGKTKKRCEKNCNEKFFSHFQRSLHH